jgi:hypothetical protein
MLMMLGFHSQLGNLGNMPDCHIPTDDDACVVNAGPTHQEVLQAALLITEHTNSVDDPLAHKLEGLLGPCSHGKCDWRSLVTWSLVV